jgi:CheY-like chemotaxis protein/signal transduction histidine kinase/HAMP domain-containing protein
MTDTRSRAPAPERRQTDTIDPGQLLAALRALRSGDFSVRLPLSLTGTAGEIAEAFNAVATLNQQTAREFDRISRVVGRDGRVGQRATLGGVTGAWLDLVGSVNVLIGDLTQPTVEVSRVLGAVAKGDLSQRMALEVDGRPLKGEFLRSSRIVNTMVDQLNSFAGEVTRVAREVGTEGKLGGQAQVPGVAGTWKDLTDSVNSMAGNLTAQVRNIAEVTTAVANGDLSKKITVDVRGEILELKETINTMVDQLNAFAGEVTRVAREVGTEGRLGGQAQVRGVGGVWKDLTESVNSMAGNLTVQLRDVSKVATAIASGDLTQKITVEVQGEILQIKDVINTMVDQLNSFAGEVTRVAREVGTEGKLGGQADVRGVAGTWKDLTDSVNSMAGNLTAQVRNIAEVTTAVANGDLSKKITVDVRGEILELKETINTMVDQLNAFASEVTRVAREVGTEGRLGGQAQVRGVAGTWKDLTDSVNFMAGNLTDQVRNIATVTTAVANGDLSKKITVEVRGEILELKDTINTMVDQLNAFASEVTRVAREVGSEGILGGQAEVRGVAGTWKDLTDSVNFMAGNLTDQVRGIARVVTAVAMGDLKRKLNVEAKGEIAALAETINSMIDTLAIFADQVTTVAREVGIEGKLGGQAQVPGVAGTWKDLTENVNAMAANLTTQVRAIGEVATAVTKGDLSRAIQVEAQGEVESLKDNINTMVDQLRETTRINTEQDWLKTNLARFTGMLQGQKDLQTVGRMILSELAPLVNVQHGVFYLNEPTNGQPLLKLLASYAYRERKNLDQTFRLGQGLVGQCAFEKERILLTNVPPDYVEISSGLGAGAPLNIVVLPVLFEGEIKAVIELASFNRFSDVNLSFLDQLTESIGIVLNTLEANLRTEELLKQSQGLTQELQQQQEELQQTNEELEEKARLLSEQNEEVERRRREIDEARAALEQKAEQLALTSKYKSQFLANMSHELRTPLNSLLILSQQLADNPDGNLTDRQVEFAGTIRASGNDLLTLINDILDLSKIESGTTTVNLGPVSFRDLREDLDRTFRQVALQKALEFRIDLDPGLPSAIQTDETRLQQILKNLLSNAFKFTDRGGVTVRIATARRGWQIDNESLNRAREVVAFAVTDTGIGIPEEKQAIVFEAFQQADMETSRKFGGTGLGLAISREIAQLLGGEIQLQSLPGRGSTFTLYLPIGYQPPSRGGEGDGHSRADDRLARTVAAVSEPPAWLSREEPRPSPVGESATAVAEIPRGEVADDRDTISPDDRVVLIVEDDVSFARVVLETARERGFKGLVATRGDVGLEMARRYEPDAITLDIQVPEIDGWRLLDLLKHDPKTRHIPVHIISVEEPRRRALEAGAIAHLRKPPTREQLTAAFDEMLGFVGRQKRLLVVEDDEVQRKAIVELIGNGDVKTTTVGSGAQALEALDGGAYDCVVLDLGLPDMDGFALIEQIKGRAGGRGLPIIVYTGRELTRREETRLRKLAETIIVKDARSPERLLDETALFLHRVEAKLPEPKRRMLEAIHRSDPVLEGRRVLIVDDDMRNIFALTSALERYKLNVSYAENGRDGIEALEQAPDAVDIVLMDIMMPEMDGYETTRRIRENPRFKSLPIIALTAKAMKGDREKCIDAGASDYITKPVDVEQLLSLLRVWLYR